MNNHEGGRPHRSVGKMVAICAGIITAVGFVGGLGFWGGWVTARLTPSAGQETRPQTLLLQWGDENGRCANLFEPMLVSGPWAESRGPTPVVCGLSVAGGD